MHIVNKLFLAMICHLNGVDILKFTSFIFEADPSLPMPFWDKSRLLLHGRLTTSIDRMKWIYTVSQDPYNTTELLDWTWNNAVTDWTNGRPLCD